MSGEIYTILEQAKDYGVDEHVVLYTSKIDVREWVAARSALECGEKSACQSKWWGTAKTNAILKEYSKAALVLTKTYPELHEAMINVEQELKARGYYKALALFNGPCHVCNKLGRPVVSTCGIDVFSTLKKFKKNLEPPKEGEFLPAGIILIE